MKLIRDGADLVTTLVYVGSQESVAVAATCPHARVTQEPPQPTPDGKWIMMERCRDCCAARARVSDKKPAKRKES